MAEYLTNCHFYFEADGITDKLIQKIAGLGVESPVAGGNAYVGATKKGVTQLQATPTTEKFTNVTVTLVATNELDLYQWYENCNHIQGGKKWTDNRKTASVVVYDQAGSEQARWDIQNAYPCKYKGPDLDATATNMATETLELVHQGIRRVK